MFPPVRKKKKTKKGKKRRRKEGVEADEEQQPQNGARRRLHRPSQEPGSGSPRLRPVTSRDVRLWLVEQMRRDLAEIKDDQLVVYYITARTLRGYVPARGPAAKHLTATAATLREEIQQRARNGTLPRRFADAVNALDGLADKAQEQAPPEQAPPEQPSPEAPSEQEPSRPPADSTDREAPKAKPPEPTTVVTDAPPDDEPDKAPADG